MIGIIVPYYQRESGLLRRAIQSVAQQQGGADWRIYIVDDTSPAPVEGELCGLPVGLLQKITVLHQRNAGPGAARNLALDALSPDIAAVAFLDSDDIWSSAHLANATSALEKGAGFYFSDHQREEDGQTRFSQCAFHPDGLAIEGSILWCSSQAVFKAVVQRSPVGTSTVAVRRDCIGSRRFHAGLRSAGEDSIFWLEILAAGPRTACSTANEVAYGRGVSIFNHRSWGDSRSLRTILDQMRAQLYLRRAFRLDPVLRASCDEQCRALDLAFCSALVACGRRLQWAAARPATLYAGARPLALMQLPKALGRALRQRHQQGEA